ncbi:MAG: hypothetical protein M1495_00690 [Bacteroidetes bacterium]|nr:hypothetical protein [Bacteroidota bacterium]
MGIFFISAIIVVVGGVLITVQKDNFVRDAKKVTYIKSTLVLVHIRIMIKTFDME